MRLKHFLPALLATSSMACSLKPHRAAARNLIEDAGETLAFADHFVKTGQLANILQTGFTRIEKDSLPKFRRHNQDCENSPPQDPYHQSIIKDTLPIINRRTQSHLQVLEQSVKNNPQALRRLGYVRRKFRQAALEKKDKPTQIKRVEGSLKHSKDKVIDGGVQKRKWWNLKR